ncbi:polycystin-2-like [Schistocerca nitens]|uniref:polycystin-2-like n=1 Tax=Schistocerca nitens TaxID=7011 RepID=UPI0021198385|nr:polycystin-2-like [Schistocerca nitens]
MIEGLYRSSVITTTKAEIAGQDRKVLNENKVLGVPRLRQLRVRNDSCEVPAIFTRTFSTCYDAYSSAAEEKEPFGPRDTTAWRYTSSEELDGISYMGTISNYHGGGYYQDLSIVPNETVNIVASLKKNLWINRSTRAVFLDFTVYNANINLFCVIKLLFEFPPTGGVLSSHDFTSMKLIRYVEPLDYAAMGFEFLFLFFVLFFTMEEVIEMMFFKLQYLFHFWNYIDLVILLCAKDLAAFGLLFFIAICAYAQLGYSLFGTKGVTEATNMIVKGNIKGELARDFRGIGISVVTLLRTIVGYNIYESIQKADWFFAPIYYIAYVVFVFLILLNMFIAIIVYSYSEVKAEIAVMDDDLHLTDFLKRHFKNVMEKFGVYSTYESKSKDKEKKLTYNDIREILRECKFTDLEIEMFFAKYDITGERIVTEHDTHRMLRDMGWVDKEDEDVEPEEDSGVSADEFEE